MKKLLMRGWLASAVASYGIVAFSASAQMMNQAMQRPTAPVQNLAPVAKDIPVGHWIVDTAGGVAKVSARSGKQQKAASDTVSVFRPLPGCRLYDSRTGFPSALGTLGGTWAGNALRTLNAGGQCGIPAGGNVAGLSLAINVFNWSNPATGRIAMMPVGGSIAGNQVGFTAAQWFWTAANVKAQGGNFDAQILDITAELIIDVNGYYADVNELDTDGAQELDINYAGTGGQAFVVNATAATGNATALGATSSSANGAALYAANFAGGNALRIDSGRLAITGAASENSTTATAFVHRTLAGSICATSYSIIKHTQLDNNPNALVMVTPRWNSSSTHPNQAPVIEYFVGGCNSTTATTGHWYIYVPGATLTANLLYNILIIQP